MSSHDVGVKNGDVIALYLDDDDDKLGAKLGYLGSDPTALSSVTATIEEELLAVVWCTRRRGRVPVVVPVAPPFRIDIGRRESFGTDLLYGQSVVLTTEHRDAAHGDVAGGRAPRVDAAPRRTSVEPRYSRPRAKVYAGDHILLQSRRYAGRYLHSTSLGPPEDAPGGRPALAARPPPRASVGGGRQSAAWHGREGPRRRVTRVAA